MIDRVSTNMKWMMRTVVAITLALPFLMPAPVHAQQKQRPNILVIWGDDIGT